VVCRSLETGALSTSNCFALADHGWCAVYTVALSTSNCYALADHGVVVCRSLDTVALSTSNCFALADHGVVFRSLDTVLCQPVAVSL
jgi:hypothetical protein